MAARVTVLVMSLVLLGGCGGGGAPGHAGGEQVVVPRVVGLSRSDAACRLVGAGLRWRGGGEHDVQDDTPIACDAEGVGMAPDPVVKRQRPRAGAHVKPGTVVVIEDECTLLRFRADHVACA